MALNSPSVHFLKICADLSKKPKSIKAINFRPTERPHHTLSENSGPCNSSQDIKE